ncbi:MAG: TonB-dependent receptor [Opitutaceae bacterium]|nr:TonB-dependent receptor [Opitutaceae bacterium]
MGARNATATITGRVFNLATGYYLKNAEVRLDGTDNTVFTDDAGYYAIAVPPGPVSLTVTYASVRPATATADTTHGGTHRLDFDLQPITIAATPAATAATGEKVITLDAFNVTAERDGQAKAIQDQRAAPNAMTAIATDNFGELSLGALGEFLRFMPGITLDGVAEPEGVRVGGLDAKYTNFTRDGVAVAASTSDMGVSYTGGNSGGNNARAFNLLPMSVVGIESIEFHHTLTARMDAGGAAGTVNIVSKNLFTRKKDEFRFQIGLNGSSDHIDLSRTYMPDDRRYHTTLPGFQFSYGGVFDQGRLGVDLSASYNESYIFTQYTQSTYAYKNPAPGLHPEGTDFDADPPITGLQFLTSHSFRTRGSVNLTTDYKLSSRLVLGLRANYSFYDNEYFTISQALWGRMASGMFIYGPSEGYDLNHSDLTRIIVHANNGINARVEQTRNNRLNHTANHLISPRLSYKHGPLAAELRLGYSRSETTNRSAEKGYFYSNGMIISRLGWTATRDSSTSPEWTLAQISGEGENWSNAENWARGDNFTEPHRLADTDNTAELLSAYLDLTYATRVLGHPVTFKFGGGARNNDFSYNARYAYYTYVGDTYDQRQATLPWNQNYSFNFKLGGKGGNIDSLSWPVLNSRELYSTFLAHPEQFNPDTVDDFRRNLLAPRDLTERIEAAYLELNTRLGPFGINAGLRDERTITDVKILQMRPNDEVTAAGLSTSSIPGILYQYHDGHRATRHRTYNNLFLSGGIKYDFTKNLRLQLSASQSMLRPDYGNIAGVVAYPDSAYTTQMWIPNPLLKPELTTKTFARLEWYLRPAGLLSLSAYRLDIKNKQIRGIEIPHTQASSQVGFELEEYTTIRDPSGGASGPDGTPEDGDTGPAYVEIPMRYMSTINAEGTRNVLGLTLEYRQQLTFLPGLLKGTRLFGSITLNDLQNARDDYERIWNVEKSANGGIGYRYGRFNIQFRASWTDDVLDAVSRPSPGRYYYENAKVYRKGRTIVDITGALRLNPHLEIGFGVRNPLNTPYCLYSEKQHRLRAYRYDGAVWSFNLRGTF